VRLRAAVAASSLTIALGACGGDSGTTGGDGGTFTRDASADCLSGLGDTSDTLDYIAEGASGGGIRLVTDDKEVMVAFGEDGDEAGDIEDAYGPFVDDTRTKGNVVMAWTDDPSEEQADAVEECLE